jgi:hypothetical protein
MTCIVFVTERHIKACNDYGISTLEDFTTLLSRIAARVGSPNIARTQG